MNYSFFFVDSETLELIKSLRVNGVLGVASGDIVVLDGIEYLVLCKKHEFLEGRDVKQSVIVKKIEKHGCI